MSIKLKDLPPEVRSTLRAVPKSKYRAIPTVYNGVRYASKAEAARAEELDFLVRTGEVAWWIGQPKFRLGVPENVYVPDFIVGVIPNYETDGELLVHAEDVKGTRTQKFNRDIKLWRRYGAMPLHVLKRKRNGWEREVVEVQQYHGEASQR